MISQAIAFPECSSTCPRVARLERENTGLKEEIAVKDKLIERLQCELRKYKNPHTPPSRRLGSSRRRKRTPREKESKPRRGHEGVTRPRPKPAQTRVVREKRCTNCGMELGEPSHTETRVIEDIQEPRKVKAIEFEIGHYECDGCGEKVVAEHEDLPPEGRFGNNVVVQAPLSKYEKRLPHRKISDLLRWEYDLDISPSTVLDLTRRAADWLRPNYKKILQEVRSADVVYVDETSIKINGRKGWIWTFTTDDVTLFAIRMSRGKGVLKEVLGEDFHGIIVCDGLSSYAAYIKNIAPGSNLQRCWAHLLREADDLKSEEGERLANRLHEIYDDLKTFLLGDPPPEERGGKRRWAEAAVRELTEDECEDERVADLIGKIKNGFDHWFTAITEPGVELTNNRAERALREHVVQRKIIGTLRNEKGMRIHETVTTMLATWKQKGLDPYEEMHKAIRS
ncbi:hypothetical protein AKJ47_01315 [candidate division MSBL1 archaeon SCGC-AAA261G05]|uniref:Transposase IS66 central domain-containing protein n=1 Tax=candidate division MSBL1 archaeon SCGC-AAA261G05 TaxID=1698276 RepID=A0A133VBZ1_9EURY|nr:hypothetical protein AKJ47_01315 [candidate division MSBL1 archaeon SCGC-AAA261G05]